MYAAKEALSGFSSLSLTELDNCGLDQLLFIASGVKPSVKLCDLRIKHKKHLMEKLKVATLCDANAGLPAGTL